jgi:hypothetical protein
MRVIIVALSACLVVAGCSDSPAPKKAVHRTTPAPTTTSPSPKPKHKHKHKHKRPQRSLLAGRWHKRNGRVYAVKIDNTHAAHPQVGLSRADVVYIEQVEGGATRLCAVYSSKYPVHVGPVRSARITDINLLRQYGVVGLFYSGAQVRLQDDLHRSTLHLVSNDASSYGYARVGRPAPYNVIGTFKTLIRRAGRHISKPRRVGYTFGPAPTNRGTPAHHVTVVYPFARVDAQWNRRKGRWLLSMDGQADRQVGGFRLGPTTFVVQSVRITASVFYDILHNNTPRTHTIGHGRALFFRNGRLYHGSWSRRGPKQATHYTIGKGKHRRTMVFAPGQIWVALVGRHGAVSVR